MVMISKKMFRVSYSQIANRFWIERTFVRFRHTGKFKRQNRTANTRKSDTPAVFDDELYHDRHFDFDDNNDGRQQRKSVKKLFQEDDVRAREVSQEIRKFVNALYEDDDDQHEKIDGRPSANRKNIFQHAHDRFERTTKDVHDVSRHAFQEESPKERKLRKKKERILEPLPYDITPENRFEILKQIVMPLHQMPYEQQLKRKYNKCRKVLQSLGSKLRELNAPIKMGQSMMPCLLEPIRPSPVTERYRNKDEFSIWPGIDGNPKTLGFFVGQPSVHERVVCVEPDPIIITKESHLDLAKKFQRYLREESPYDVCTNFGEGGNWRRFHIRSNRLNHHMITAIMHPQDLTEDQLQEEMDRLRRYFSGDELVKSLYFHATRHTRSTHTGEPYRHLDGDPTITETLFDKEFVISPSSFFQVNTAAAEILYRVIMTELRPTKKTTVLDLCCGTGTLSILLSRQVKKIIAIDSSVSAIEDARINAERNGVTNIEFIVGTVEEVLPRFINDNYLREPVVAVANPSRRALHPNAVRTLKHAAFIQRLVYVSCKPEGDALRNFVHFCNPGTRFDHQVAPFVPINAIPVDLFPHTEHCELVLTFERFE